MACALSPSPRALLGLLLRRQPPAARPRLYRRASRAPGSGPAVAVVGSGPGGFYVSQQLLKKHPTATVDIYERLPVPFGLVRCVRLQSMATAPFCRLPVVR